jgi:hypothetical protein
MSAARTPLVPLKVCARCRRRPPMHPYMGCLCEPCEDETEHMTQAELDADYERHQDRGDDLTCGLCGFDFTPDREPDRLAHQGREVVVCPDCSRLEGD